jgi:Arm DNA-binding domain
LLGSDQAGSLSKSWVFRYQVNGRTREMGLGSFNTFGLRDARDRATSCRKLLADGIDPIELRNATQQKQCSSPKRGQ